MLMNEKQSSLTIGRLAKVAGVNIETIRHYQRRGLIDEPEKPLTGFRQYPLEIIDRIRFIKRAQPRLSIIARLYKPLRKLRNSYNKRIYHFLNKKADGSRSLA